MNAKRKCSQLKKNIGAECPKSLVYLYAVKLYQPKFPWSKKKIWKINFEIFLAYETFGMPVGFHKKMSAYLVQPFGRL